MNPKTPARYRSRSEVKTPLTPSLVSALNAVTISSPHKRRARSTSKPSAPFDTSNPFIAPSHVYPRSRPPSPIKCIASCAIPVSELLESQPSCGVIRRGGIESRLDVVTRDYVPPPKPTTKRSRSTPAMGRDRRDRFITNREDTELTATLDQSCLNPLSSSPGHTARLAEAAGVPLDRRILGYHEPPPSASDKTLVRQRELVRPLYTRPTTAQNSTSATTNKTRRFPTLPDRVLDAPGMVDDFYLNLISWSCLNTVAVALDTTTYLWRADTGSVDQISEVPEGSYIASVQFSNDGMFLGIGTDNGEVDLLDVETKQRLRTMSGHQGQVATLSWHSHILTSGCADGSIWHNDVRIARHKVMELLGHSGEVCGLEWRKDGELLASGGNDNVVNIWDGRVGDVTEGSRGSAKWTKRNHTAAVKAIAWCPWQSSLLASGGGTNDATINVWNTTTGARLHSVRTPSQVTSIQWAKHKKEVMSTHGYPTNSIMVHAYPSMERLTEIRDAHDSRVLFSAISPAGDVVCTGAGDENLKFWKIWDGAAEAKRKKEPKEVRPNSTVSGILSIR